MLCDRSHTGAVRTVTAAEYITTSEGAFVMLTTVPGKGSLAALFLRSQNF